MTTRYTSEQIKLFINYGESWIDGKDGGQIKNEILWQAALDAERLEWLESQAKKSWMYGVSMDHVPTADGDPSGYRVLRRGHITEPKKDIREAIDAAIAEDES